MTLIVEIEEFLKEGRCHVVEAADRSTIVMIRLPRYIIDQGVTTDLDADDDDLITWEDAAWQ